MKIEWKKITVRDLASLVCRKLNEKDIDAVLVGGACVTIYTKNKYVSYDLDFVSHTSLKEIAAVLDELGFRRESTRHFIRKDCPFFIEFVAPPLSIGSEPVKDKNSLRTKYGELLLLTPTDTVKDRLAAFYHWNDQQALDQAVMVANSQEVAFREIKRWSEKERHSEKYFIFYNRFKK